MQLTEHPTVKRFQEKHAANTGPVRRTKLDSAWLR